jgi:hypothetical protein
MATDFVQDPDDTDYSVAAELYLKKYSFLIETKIAQAVYTQSSSRKL